jgi:hypothetical protein
MHLHTAVLDNEALTFQAMVGMSRLHAARRGRPLACGIEQVTSTVDTRGLAALFRLGVALAACSQYLAMLTLT